MTGNKDEGGIFSKNDNVIMVIKEKEKENKKE